MTGKELLIKIGRMVVVPGIRSADDPGFQIDSPQLLSHYRNIYQYLTDDNFSEWAKHKGLIFSGGVGTGKTVAMKVIQKLAISIRGLDDRKLAIVPVSDFLLLFKENEPLAYQTYGKSKKAEICIEELGWEATQKHYYGNDTASIIASWVLERYDLFIETGIRTYFTTNLFLNDPAQPTDIFRLYGKRTLDRLNEMTSIVNWVGGSLRK